MEDSGAATRLIVHLLEYRLAALDPETSRGRPEERGGREPAEQIDMGHAIPGAGGMAGRTLPGGFGAGMQPIGPVHQAVQVPEPTEPTLVALGLEHPAQLLAASAQL